MGWGKGPPVQKKDTNPEPTTQVGFPQEKKKIFQNRKIKSCGCGRLRGNQHRDQPRKKDIETLQPQHYVGKTKVVGRKLKSLGPAIFPDER